MSNFPQVNGDGPTGGVPLGSVRATSNGYWPAGQPTAAVWAALMVQVAFPFAASTIVIPPPEALVAVASVAPVTGWRTVNASPCVVKSIPAE
jgi:hypothetical protein